MRALLVGVKYVTSTVVTKVVSSLTMASMDTKRVSSYPIGNDVAQVVTVELHSVRVDVSTPVLLAHVACT